LPGAVLARVRECRDQPADLGIDPRAAGTPGGLGHPTRATRLDEPVRTRRSRPAPSCYLTIVNLTVIGFALPLALLAVSVAVSAPGVSAFLPMRPLKATVLAPGCRFLRVSVPALIARVHFFACFFSPFGAATQLLPRLTPGAERA